MGLLLLLLSVAACFTFSLSAALCTDPSAKCARIIDTSIFNVLHSYAAKTSGGFQIVIKYRAAEEMGGFSTVNKSLLR